MITSWGLWVPGALVSMNRGLSLARAAGFRQGQGLRGGDLYAEAARNMRTLAGLRARAARLPSVPADRVARLRFTVMGHPRWDAAAGALVAKWIEDGLVDVGVLPSDRFNVREVSVAKGAALPTAVPGVYLAVDVLPREGT